MTDQEFDAIQQVHLKGAYACTKAAWPIFRKQKFGRVVNTASAAGLYGIICRAFLTKEILKYVVQETLVKQTTVQLKWGSLPSQRHLLVREPSTTLMPLLLHR